MGLEELLFFTDFPDIYDISTFLMGCDRVSKLIFTLGLMGLAHYYQAQFGIFLFLS